MNSVFIVNTHLHLIISQSIIKKNKLENCILIYIGVNAKDAIYIEEELWLYMININQMKSKYDLKIFIDIFNNYLFKRVSCDDLYFGNDYQIENQIIRRILRPKNTVLFDDGIGSYIVNKNNNSARNFLNIALKKILGINSYGIGYSDYDKRISLIKIKNESTIDIDIKIKDYEMDFLKEKIKNDIGCFNDKAIIFLTQPTVEYNDFPFECEKELLTKAIENINKLGYKKLLIKSHPKENCRWKKERLNLINGLFLGDVYKTDAVDHLPVEVLSYLYNDNFHYSSLYSSALVTISLMFKNKTVFSALNADDLIALDKASQVSDLFKISNVKMMKEMIL